MYAWTGKILRLNMTTKTATIEDNKYCKEYLGGQGLADRIIYDEVPTGTHPQDDASKIVIAAGTLCGTGAACSGRTSVALMSAFTEVPTIVDAHMGGNMAPQIKFSGYDAIIVEGKADAPTWVKIHNDEVSFEDASGVWGLGTRKTTEILNQEAGPEYCVCAIGPAGENLVNDSIIVNSMCHAAGAGSGAVFGSKKLKAIVIHGTKSVAVADPMKTLELQQYQLRELIGVNNNHVQPSNQQSWNEFVGATRWQGGPGKMWGEAIGGPLDTGEQKPGDINAIGMRNHTINFFMGNDDIAFKHTVKTGGCYSCPIRCFPDLHFDALKEYGTQYNTATCMTLMHAGDYYNGHINDFVDPGDGVLTLGSHIQWLMDDYGVWCGYGDLDYTFAYCMKNDIFKQKLSAEEYAEIPWALQEAGDPQWANEMVSRIATKKGEFGRVLGLGSLWTAKEWGFPDSFWNEATGNYFNFKKGYIRHHSSESFGQVGGLVNIVFNRDSMCHTHQNCLGNGLPYDIVKGVLEEKFGEGCADKTACYTPMNPAKAKFAKWAIVRNNVHDSLALCNWVWPMTFSPMKERGYKGDTALEAKLLTAVTGEEWTEESVDFVGERIMQLQRAMTALELNSKNLRADHDGVSDWVFDRDPDKAAFTEGTTKLDRADWETALDLYYEEWGWDKATGIPTRATLEKFNLADLADKLEAAGLLPA